MIEAKKYNEARAMRGKQFIDSQAAFVTFARPKPHFHAPSVYFRFRFRFVSFFLTHAPLAQSTAPHIAVMHAGASSPGMNTAVRAAVRLALDKGDDTTTRHGQRDALLTRNDRSRAGFRVFAIYEGFEGLVRGDVREVDWMTVNGWSSIGGSLLGTSRAAPKVPRQIILIALTAERCRC